MSGAFDGSGKAWMWGFGTNSQLGKGNDDGDEEVLTCFPTHPHICEFGIILIASWDAIHAPVVIFI